MNIVPALLNSNPDLKIAVIDKDEPGGICLTKGCIPTKILLYPAEIIRNIQRAKNFGIEVDIKKIDFKFVMERMRSLIYHDINNIQQGLSQATEFDYYQEIAEFIDEYTLKVGKETIKGKTILLCTGSKPKIPNIKGLDKVDYHTSDSILKISELPKSITIVGGGYIAAEYGFFFDAMGSEVTILGRNPQFLPQEEPEISALALKDLSKNMRILTNHEVIEVEKTKDGKVTESTLTLSDAVVKLAQSIPLVGLDEISLSEDGESSDLQPEQNTEKTDIQKVRQFAEEKKIPFRQAMIQLAEKGEVKIPNYASRIPQE